MRETLTVVRKTPGCLLLLLGNFAITFGSNLVLPYLAVYLTVEQGISPWAVGAAFTTKLWAQQGLMVFGGAVADRLGTVRTMCLGLLLRAASYILIVELTTDVGAVVSCGLLGLGSALYIPAGKAALSRLIDGRAATVSVFALRSAANNTGSALGPLAGGLLLLLDRPAIGFLAAAGLFLALLPAFWQLRHKIPSGPYGSGAQPSDEAPRTRPGLLAVFRTSPRMVWIVAAAVLFGFCYVQIEYAMPITAAAAQGASFVGVLYTVNAVAVVALQLVASGYLGKVASPGAVVAGGLVAMAAGFGLFGEGSILLLLLGTVFFTLGEVIVDPRLDAEVARTVPPAQRATAFGMVGLGVALGGTVANATASSPLGPAAQGSGYWLLLLVTVSVLALATWITAPDRKPTPAEPQLTPLTTTPPQNG